MRNSTRGRKPRLETLEGRSLLSVTPVDVLPDVPMDCALVAEPADDGSSVKDAEVVYADAEVVVPTEEELIYCTFGGAVDETDPNLFIYEEVEPCQRGLEGVEKSDDLAETPPVGDDDPILYTSFPAEEAVSEGGAVAEEEQIFHILPFFGEEVTDTPALGEEEQTFHILPVFDGEVPPAVDGEMPEIYMALGAPPQVPAAVKEEAVAASEDATPVVALADGEKPSAVAEAARAKGKEVSVAPAEQVNGVTGYRGRGRKFGAGDGVGL